MSSSFAQANFESIDNKKEDFKIKTPGNLKTLLFDIQVIEEKAKLLNSIGSDFRSRELVQVIVNIQQSRLWLEEAIKLDEEDEKNE